MNSNNDASMFDIISANCDIAQKIPKPISKPRKNYKNIFVQYYAIFLNNADIFQNQEK